MKNRLDSKKFAKLASLFETLFTDKTPYITGEYVKQVETFLTLFFELFVNPDFQDLPPVFPRFDSWDKTQEIETTGEMWFGETTLNDHIVINTGVLFFAASVYEDLKEAMENDDRSIKIYQSSRKKAEKEFFEYRNELLSRLIDTVAHECRHGMQKMYVDFLKKPTKHKKSIQVIKTRLGKITEELKDQSSDSFADTTERDFMDSELLSDFAYDLGLINKKQYDDYQQQMLSNDTSYQITPAEKDARRYASIKMWELTKALREYQATVRQILEKGSVKTDATREKFYKLSNARADLFLNISDQIVDEIDVAQRGKVVKSIEKQIARKITPENLIDYAKKYTQEYAKHSKAEQCLLKFLTSLLRNKELRTFFANKQNIETLYSELKLLNFPTCAKLLKNHSSSTSEPTLDK